jgi:hypothetical protein
MKEQEREKNGEEGKRMKRKGMSKINRTRKEKIIEQETARRRRDGEKRGGKRE